VPIKRMNLVSAMFGGTLILGIGIANLPAPNLNPPYNQVLELNAPAPIARILDRSCADCHSHRTHWPWYARLPIVLNVLESDVIRGRQQMNFSRWNDSRRNKEDVLANYSGICEQIKDDAMPLRKYVLAHPSARLSREDKEQLCSWVNQESARLTTR
jgi:hypothetical protein